MSAITSANTECVAHPPSGVRPNSSGISQTLDTLGKIADLLRLGLNSLLQEGFYD